VSARGGPGAPASQRWACHAHALRAGIDLCRGRIPDHLKIDLITARTGEWAVSGTLCPLLPVGTRRDLHRGCDITIDT
jgi:hypothetical protein